MARTSVVHSSFRIERSYPNSPGQVFAAFSDPVIKAKWFAGPQDEHVSVSLTTVEFEPDGDGTKLTFTEQGAFFDGLDDPDGREHGTGKLLDGLGDVLADQG